MKLRIAGISRKTEFSPNHVLNDQRRAQQARDCVTVIAPGHNSHRLACGFRPYDRVKN